MEALTSIAHLSRVRGNKGELIGESLTSHPERFETLERVFLVRPGVGPVEMQVDKIWDFRGSPVFKFHGVDSISQAEAWKGFDVAVPDSERVPLEPGEYFLSDLEGCEVRLVSGERVGVVTGTIENGPQILLEVSAEGRKQPALIPFVKALFPTIDVNGKVLIVDPPAGLIDVNE